MSQTPNNQSYTTKLDSSDELKFKTWVKQNNVPWKDEPRADYDMRGYWRAQQSGDPNAKRAPNLHFPDTWKTPYHHLFSNESKYATPDAPHWDNHKLIDKTGKVWADETPQHDVPSILRKVELSPKYQALNDTQKGKFRGLLFDRVAGPYLKSKGVDISGDFKNEWVSRQFNQRFSKPEPQSSAKHLFVNYARTGAEIGQGALSATRDLVNWVSSHDEMVKKSPAAQRVLEQYNRSTDDSVAYFKEKEDWANNWLGEHYQSNMAVKATELPANALGFFLNKDNAKSTIGYTAVTELTGGLGAGLMEGAGIKGLMNFVAESASPTVKFAATTMRAAAEGYLGAKLVGEDPKQTAGQFAKITAGVEAIPYLGRLLGFGGPRLATQSLDMAAKFTKEEAAKLTTDSPIKSVLKANVAVLNEVAQKLGHDDFWNAQAKGKGNEVMQGAVALLSQANKESAIHNPELVEAQVKQRFTELNKNPLGQAVLGILKNSGVDVVKATVKDTQEGVKALAAPKESAKEMAAVVSSTGAAHAKSIEFGDNLTKVLKDGKGDKFWEDRTHKFLYAFNSLVDGSKDVMFRKEGKFVKKSDVYANLLNMIKSDPKFKDMSLEEIKQAAANTKAHADKLKEGERFFRQTEVRPGFDQFEHQSRLHEERPTETKQEPKYDWGKTSVGKAGEKDTSALMQAVKELYPTKTFATLTSEERIKATNRSLEIAKKSK